MSRKSLSTGGKRPAPAEKTTGFAPVAERFRRGGDLERAVTLCREGLSQFPDHLSGRVTLGWALLDLGRYEEARTELEHVLRRAPDNLAAIRGLAELHDRAESTMLLDVADPGRWPPDESAIGDDPPGSPPAATESAAPPPIPVPAIAASVQDAGTPEIVTAAQAAMEHAAPAAESRLTVEEIVGTGEIAAAVDVARVVPSDLVEPAAPAPDVSLETAMAELDAASRLLDEPPGPEMDLATETAVAAEAGPGELDHLVAALESSPAETNAALDTPLDALALETSDIESVALETVAIEPVILEPSAAESGEAAFAPPAPALTGADPGVAPTHAAEPVAVEDASGEPELAAAAVSALDLDVSQAVFADAQADAASHAEALAAMVVESGQPAALEADVARLADVPLDDAPGHEPVDHVAFAEASAVAEEAFSRAQEESAELAEQVTAFAEAIEPASAVEPVITRVGDVTEQALDETAAADLVPADAESAFAGAARIAEDLAAAASLEPADESPADVALEPYADMHELVGGGRLIEPLTHTARSAEADESADAPAAFDAIAAAFAKSAETPFALQADTFAAADGQESAGGTVPTTGETTSAAFAAAFMAAETAVWTPPAASDSPPLPVDPIESLPHVSAIEPTAAALEAAERFEVARSAPEEMGEAPVAALAGGVTASAVQEAPIELPPEPQVCAVDPGYDGLELTDHAVVAPVAEAVAPARGHSAPPQKSPIAALERMLRRIHARRQVVSESVA